VVLRGVWTIVLLCWLAGPLAGGGCLRACPEPAPSAGADTCHASAPGVMLSGTHDCGIHFSASRDVVVSKGRSDVAPAPQAHITTAASVAAVRASESHTPVDNSPPIRFLIPLRT
jgi:hypothetical protein